MLCGIGITHRQCPFSDCQSRQGFWGSPPPELHKPPELYHRPTGTSFSAGAVGSLDAFIRSGGGCTVSLPSARLHDSDQPSLLVGHMEKCGKRAETRGLPSGTALKRTPNTDSQLVGGPSPLPPQLSSFPVGEKGVHRAGSYQCCN